MSEPKLTELERMEILRLSNQESNHITKNCIESALMLLMKDRCIHDISITDIVKRAGVSRTAYYRNYNSKEDILRSIMQKIVEQFMDELKMHPPVKNTYNCWHRLFHTVNQHAEFLQLLLKANLGDVALDEIHRRAVPHPSPLHLQGVYSAYFWIGAIYNLVAAWIRNGMGQSVEEMAEISYQIVNSMTEVCAAIKEQDNINAGLNK